MVIFHSYVSLPEGIHSRFDVQRPKINGPSGGSRPGRRPLATMVFFMELIGTRWVSQRFLKGLHHVYRCYKPFPVMGGLWLFWPLEKYLVGGACNNHIEKWWSESQWEGWHPVYEMENKLMFETTNQCMTLWKDFGIWHLVDHWRPTICPDFLETDQSEKSPNSQLRYPKWRVHFELKQY